MSDRIQAAVIRPETQVKPTPRPTLDLTEFLLRPKANEKPEAEQVADFRDTLTSSGVDVDRRDLREIYRTLNPEHQREAKAMLENLVQREVSSIAQQIANHLASGMDLDQMSGLLQRMQDISRLTDEVTNPPVVVVGTAPDVKPPKDHPHWHWDDPPKGGPAWPREKHPDWKLGDDGPYVRPL